MPGIVQLIIEWFTGAWGPFGLGRNTGLPTLAEDLWPTEFGAGRASMFFDW